MVRIMINDLSSEHEVNREDMKKVFGGVESTTFPDPVKSCSFGGGFLMFSGFKTGSLFNPIIPDNGGAGILWVNPDNGGG